MNQAQAFATRRRQREPSKTTTRLARAKSSRDCLHAEPAETRSTGADRGFVRPRGGTSILAVPTADPFLRERKPDEEGRRSRKVLNPGSCASAMDLLVLAHAGSIGSMQSLQRATTTALHPSSCASGAVPTADPFLRKRKLNEEKPRTRKFLNPGSCASAMDLLALAGFQGQGSRRGSMASLSSAVSDASQLLRAIQGNVSQSSLFSASANGFALLLGSSSSSRGRGSNTNNARVCRRANVEASDGNRNADWDVFA